MKTVSFKNPVCAGADPWMFAYDGWYYLCCTHGQKIILYRSKNPATIKEDEQITAFLPPEDQPFSKSLWSPEIHYFSPEDFGEEHAGFYMFIACSDGQNIHHRMYVLRSEDRRSPFAAYGNPVTGERNIPEKFCSPEDETFNSGWC